MKFSIVLSGVGGQGTILASRTIALCAIKKGYQIRSSETLGMAQREGSVLSHLRFGEKIYSPLVPDAQADVLLGFELIEAARWVGKLKPGGVAIVNSSVIPPFDVTVGRFDFDEERTKEFMRGLKAETVMFDATSLAVEAGSFRATNAVLLGAFSAKANSPLEPELLLEVMLTLVPPKTVDVNRRAFELGREACLSGARG